MRILMVADVLPDPNSGAAGTEYQTIAALQRLGHRVDAIWANAIPRHIRHPNLHLLIELPHAFAHVIDQACRRQRYDVIHCNQPHGYLAAHKFHASGRPGVFVSRSHGFEAHAASALTVWRRRWGMRERRFPRNLPGALLDAEMRRQCWLVVRHADGLIVSCQADKSFIIQRYGAVEQRVACIPQAAPDAFLQTPTKPMTPERLRQLLFIGPPRFWKGPDVLGPAISDLLARHPELSFTWVCGRDERIAAAGYLATNVRGQVTFSDPMPQPDLLALYDRHGLFIMPSLFEGFGKVFVEAMSRGLCVVASNTGGMADLIRSGKDGLLVPAGDAGALREGLAKLLVQPEQAIAIGRLAVNTAKAYSWERVGRNTVDFYRALLERNDPHRCIPSS